MIAPDVTLVMTMLTVAAGLALAIERILEVINHLRDNDTSQADKAQVDKSTQFTLNEAKELVNAIRAVDVNKFVNAYKNKWDTQGLLDLQMRAIAKKNIAKDEFGAEMDTKLAEGENFELHSSILVMPAARPALDEAHTRLLLQLLAVGLGILFAEIFKLNLVSALLNSTNVPHWLDMVLTGIVIGGGSQPIHALIRFLSTRKVSALQAESAQEPSTHSLTAPGVSAPAASAPDIVDTSYWRPIPYDGGVNPASLEHTHLRKKAPGLVVYHHTAMSSELPFQAVVDEFLINKKWVTGYHCVIMPNGDIKPFCRWDRCGNHAKNFNEGSLGVAFHGNFHSDNRDRMSNHDGSYGNLRPTRAQLDAGGRLIALWTHLYADIDEESDIRPHSALIPGHTVCPGSNFPHAALKDRIVFYQGAWKKSKDAQRQLAEFKQRPYLYAELGGAI